MNTIPWECQICRLPIRDGDGYITVSYNDINEYQEAYADWREKNPGPLLTGGALLDHPERASWHIWHRSCDPDIDSLDYTIDIERIRTPLHVISWTAHLMEKNWIKDTDWDMVLRTLLGFAPVKEYES